MGKKQILLQAISKCQFLLKTKHLSVLLFEHYLSSSIHKTCVEFSSNLTAHLMHSGRSDTTKSKASLCV